MTIWIIGGWLGFNLAFAGYLTWAADRRVRRAQVRFDNVVQLRMRA